MGGSIKPEPLYSEYKKIMVCPVCGERFLPAYQHSYRDKKSRRLVCSYTCMRQVERLNARGQKKGKKGRGAA